MRRGVVLGLAAHIIWGLFPLFWPLLEPSGSLEILAHRMVWSAVVLALVITVMRGWPALLALKPRTWGVIAAAAAFVTVNWATYVYAVNNGHVVDAALGYFINPLVSVLLGVLVLHERLRPTQWFALAVAGIAVVISAVGTGQVPWIALMLAVSFGLYGLMKRLVRIPAVQSLAGESAIVVLPALAYVVFLQAHGTGTFVSLGAGHTALLVVSGVLTVLPLLMFGGAARRLPLSTLGFLQYVTPVIQFLLGVLWDGEHMPPARWLGFVLIWCALAIISVDAIRRQRRAPIRVGASATIASGAAEQA